MRAALLITIVAVSVGVIAGITQRGGEPSSSEAAATRPGSRATTGRDTAGELQLLVRDGGGRAVRGFEVQARTVSGEAIGEIRTTDFEGMVEWRGLPRGVVEVFAPEIEQPLGHSDVSRQRKILRVTVPSIREVELVMRVDGRPGLPERLELSSERAHIIESRREPEEGRVFVRLRPRSNDVPVALEVEGSGCEARTVEVPAVARSMLYRQPLRFVTRHGLDLQVTPPQDGDYRLEVHRFVEGLGRWRFVDVQPQKLAASSKSIWQLRDLRRGTYRVIDARSGVSTDQIELGGSDEIANATLDLSDVISVRGYVRGPEGAELGLSRVHVDGTVGSLHPLRLDGMPVLQNGAFEVRVERGREIEFSAENPLLASTPEKSRRRIRAEKNLSVELELVKGTRVKFRLSPDPYDPKQRRRDHQVYVELYNGLVAADPVFEGIAYHRDDNWWEIGGLPVGRKTWLVRAPGFSPAVVEDVTVTQDTSELSAPIELGSRGRIDVRLILPAGVRAPALEVRASHLRHPDLVRTIDGSGSREIAVPALAPGGWYVEVIDPNGHPIGPAQRVTLKEGANASASITWDLR